MELVRLEQALIGYGTPLLAPLDLQVSSGEHWAVLGPNGSGKSTLLRSLIGLVPLLGGRRTFPSGTEPRVGYVRQSYRSDPLYPLSTLDVVLQGRFGRIGVGRRVKRADREVALQQLERVGLRQVARQRFDSLSGGQQQRALVARALAGEPELLVLDEVTSDLDPAAAAALLAEVSRLVAASSVAVVFVTHEVADAAAHASHVALLDMRTGQFEAGPRDALLTADRLTRLYGRPVHLEKRDGRTVVFVESGVGP